MEDGDDYNNANMRTGDRTRMLTKHGDGAVDGKNQYHSHHQHQIDPLVASSSNVSSSSSTSSGSASMMSPNGMNGTGGIHDRKTSNHGHHHMHHHHHSNANGSIKANGGRPPAAENGVNNASSGSNHNGGNNNSSSNNTNSNNNANNNNGPDRDLQLQMAELDENARKTVSGADDVTLALLLTSWANSLEEARHHTAAGQSASTTHFEAIFNGSHALDIVTNNVLVAHPSSDSPVRKALIALFGYVLYGDHRLHARLAELVVDLNANSNGSNFNVNEAAGSTAYIGPDSSVSVAVSRTLAFLKDVASNMRAYADVLPTAPDVRDKPIRGYSPDSHSPTLESAINSKSDSFEDSASKKDDHSMLPTSEASGPAGPDPIKAVERSMDTWRRAVARLQGEMALIVVLNKALGAADVELRFDPMNGSSNSSDAFVNGVNMNVNGAAGMAVSGTSGSSAIDAFYAGVRQAVRKHIEADLSARIDRLNAVYWADVAQGAEATVFGAARERARHWARQLDSGRREVESLLDEAGIGFGPSAAVVDPTRVEVLLGAAAATAAVVACHQRAFEWAKNTAHILAAMVMAMRCLEGVADGRLSPSSELRKKFFAGLNAAYAAVDGILDWSFATLHNKVLVSLDKSCGGTGDIKIAGALASTDHALGGSPGAATIGGNDEESRGMGRNGEGGMATNGSKTLRFQEPPKTPGDPTGENGSITGRPKVRHARMKSSPDALLHLNFPRFDGYSDDDYDDVDEKIDREISFHDDDDDDDNDGNNDRRGAGHDAANQGEAHGNGADNDGKSDSASKLTSSGDIGKDSFSTGDIRMVFVDRGGANGKDVSSVTVGETEDSATEGSDKPSLSDKVRFDEGALKRGLNGSGADSGGASTNGVAGCGNGKTNGVEHGGSTAGGNEDDDCDDETEDIDMIVHGDEEDEDETVEVDVDDQTKPKKMNHASHFRSVSVDGGIPF